MRKFIALLFVALLVGCQDSPEPLAPTSQQSPRASLSQSRSASPAATDRYIVVFDADDVRDVPGLAKRITAAHGGEMFFVYRHALEGFAARLPEQAVAAIENRPGVAYIERDQIAHAYGEVPTGIARIFADENAEIGIDGTTGPKVDVDIAGIDTGIDLDHPDLNVVQSVDCSGGNPSVGSCESGGDDDNGHGTHTAGTMAAYDDGSGVVGVAPGARLWAVKVLDSRGSGYISWIVAGIDYVTAHADRIEVANMSLGCNCESDAMAQAIAASVDAGVVYAVAAGNAGEPTAAYSPADHPDVITVSALADYDGEPGGNASPTCYTDQDGTLADFSNYGSLVEIAAPGVCIRSTWLGGGYNTISGTSMAAPHVAGAAALLASGANDPTSQSDVEAITQTLLDEGNFDWTDDSGDGIQEPLLDVSDSAVFDPALVSGDGGGDGGTGTEFTLSADGYKVKGRHTIDLTWDGATSTKVDVYLNGSVTTTTANDGAYTHETNNRGNGSYTFQVCEAGTTTCSNEATVTF